MRMAFALLILAGIAFANFDSGAFSDCDKSCCTGNGGQWDSEYEYCDIDTSSASYDGYEECFEQCFEDVYGESLAEGACCCVPAFILLLLLGCAMKG